MNETRHCAGRRAVVHGLAWTAPAVAFAAAAPAMAISPACLRSVTVDWSTARYTRTSATADTAGGAANPLVLHQSPRSDSDKRDTRTNANKTVTTFTFSRPVSGLAFTITDIDSKTADFVDAVGIQSATVFTATRANTTTAGVSGTGTLTDPLRAAGRNTDVQESESRGNATIRFTGDVTSFNLHYWNQVATASTTIDGDQRIFLSAFQLTYSICP